MEIVLAALVAAAVAAAVVLVALRSRAPAVAAPGGHPRDAAGSGQSRAGAGAAAGSKASGAELDAAELRARREELAPLEERLRVKDASADALLADLNARELALAERARSLDESLERIES